MKTGYVNQDSARTDFSDLTCEEHQGGLHFQPSFQPYRRVWLPPHYRSGSSSSSCRAPRTRAADAPQPALD
jgi:hypothetical protein